jgi:hypothetical protein
MKKFKALLDYITQTNLVAQEQLESFVSDCTLQFSGKSQGNGSLVAAYAEYEASYLIENYTGNAEVILCHFASWLYNHDQSDIGEDMPLPSFDIEPVDDHTVDIMVNVTFSEKLELVQNDTGPYLFGTKYYSLNEHQVHTAETFEVDGEVCHA